MHAPTAAELLSLWENGLRQGPIDRALSVLEAAYPEQSADTLAGLSIGERDARLFRVREICFGPRIICTMLCPRCAERLEWESKVAELCVHEGKISSAELCVEAEAYRLRFRLPNSRDLAAVCEDGDGDRKGDRRQRLLRRCLMGATTPEGGTLRMEQLPETALQAMVREMERADPQSNLHIRLACPACGHGWQGLFDIVSFLWAEINHWAERTLRAVHVLAHAYGWREADILSMSPTRRQMYLEMASR